MWENKVKSQYAKKQIELYNYNSMKRKSRSRCLTYRELLLVESSGSVVLKIISEKEDRKEIFYIH